MKIFKCEMPGCKNYVSEEEIKLVWNIDNTEIVLICESCDDGSLEEVDNLGDAHESFKKIEKIRRNKKSRYDD